MREYLIPVVWIVVVAVWGFDFMAYRTGESVYGWLVYYFSMLRDVTFAGALLWLLTRK